MKNIKLFLLMGMLIYSFVVYGESSEYFDDDISEELYFDDDLSEELAITTQDVKNTQTIQMVQNFLTASSERLKRAQQGNISEQGYFKIRIMQFLRRTMDEDEAQDVWNEQFKELVMPNS